MGTKSKKLLKFIDGLRAWNLTAMASGSSQKSGIDVKEILKSDHFQLGTIVKHGFPFEPSCMAYDPVQRILAVGTRNGCIKLFGRPGVEFHLEHASSAPVLQLIFLINKGGLISICRDNVVHLWNIRQKPPDVVHSLHFKRDTLTCGHLAVSSSWLCVASEQGNVHFVNVQNFVTSGYVINWNRAMDVTQSQRPGAVVQLAEHPQDSNRLLIGYKSGLMVLWDLRLKAAESRFCYHEELYSFAWHWEGKCFISAHSSGIIVTWALNQPKRPQSVVCPHAGDDETPNSQFFFEPIRCVQWLPSKNAESIIVFFGGNRHNRLDAVINYDEGDSITPNITIMQGKRLAVMQMDFNVVTFTALHASPYFNEACESYAVAVLLEQDLVLVDLLSPGYPSFENPYPMDIAVSPVTACHYVVDCPSDLVPAFYAIASREKKAPTTSRLISQNVTAEGQTSETSNDSFSSKKWPIDGGEWGHNLCSYQEFLITGHADGSVRFWDASGVNLSPLYKVRTSRYFAPSSMDFTIPPLSSRGDALTSSCFNAHQSSTEDQLYASAVAKPLAIRLIRFCVESRTLLLASQRHICLLSFCCSEAASEIPVLDVYLHYEEDQVTEVSGGAGDDFSFVRTSTSGRRGTMQILTDPTTSAQVQSEREGKVSVAVRPGVRQWRAGYHPTLICRLVAPTLASPVSKTGETTDLSPISAIALTSATNLFAFGTDGGVAVVNYHQGICLVCAAVPELEAMDTLSHSRIKSSSRLSSPGNSCKPTRAGSNASSAGTNANQSFSAKMSQPAIVQPTPLRTQAASSNSSRSFRFPWKHRNSPQHLHRKIYRSSARRATSSKASLEYTPSGSAHDERSSQNQNVTLPQHPRNRRLQREMSSIQLSTSCLQNSLQIIDFQGTNKVKPSVISGAPPDVIAAASPLLASMMSLHLEVNKGGSIPIPSTLSDKYGDLPTQRHSDTSEQSSMDHSMLEGIRTLVFVDMSSKQNEPSLWVGTNRGSVFGFTLDTSDTSISHASNYSLLGALFKFDGEAVYIGFGSAQGEMCSAPAAKWGPRGCGVSRLTLVPHPGDCPDDRTDDSIPAESSNLSVSGRLGGSPTSISPSSPVNKLKASTSPTSPIASSLIHSGSQGASQIAASQEETLSGNNQAPPESTDRYFMVVVSEKHAQVIGFPSRNCYHRVKITETSTVIRAELCNQRMPLSTSISSSSLSTAPPTTVLFVACLLSNGHVIAFSLPSLRILSDVDVVSKPFHQTLFTFGNLGHAIYMPSPCEIAKISLAADLVNNLSEMYGELFLPCNMPDPPKKHFFSNLFTGSGLSQSEKDTLFGERQSGKSTSGTAALLPSGRMDRLPGQASGVTSEISRARSAAVERGEKLSHLDTQVQEMMDQSKNLGKTAAMLAAKYEKQDKWWSVWPR